MLVIRRSLARVVYALHMGKPFGVQTITPARFLALLRQNIGPLP